MKPLICSISILFSSSLLADAIILEPVVVSATRTPQSKTDVLASIDIISPVDIERTQAKSLSELLVGRAGIDVSNSGGFGGLSDVRIRGTNSDHVLVLVDGVKMGSVTFGTFAFQNFPIHTIDHIEIVKGPRSSLYGSEAIGGVIHIFTKKGGNRPFLPQLNVSYGTHETSEVRAGFTGSSGSTDYGLTVKSFNTEGIDATNVNNIFANNLDKDGYDEDSVSLNISHRFSDTVEISGNFVRSEGENESDESLNLRDGAEIAQQALGLTAKISPVDFWTSTISVGESRDESESFGANPSVFDTERAQFSWQQDFFLSEDHIVTLGFDFVDDKLTSTTVFDEDSRQNKAFFAQWQGAWHDWDWVTAIRNDDNTAFGDENTGSLAIGYTFPKALKIVGSYGTAFKAPTFNDLFFPFTDFGFGFTFQGNPDLKPEESESWELAIRQKTAWGKWSVSFFYTEIENLISLSADFSTIDNIANARIRGVESSIATTLWGWDSQFQFTYIDPKDADTGQVLNRRPLRTARFSLDRQIDDWGIHAEIIAQGHRFDDAANNTRLSGYHVTNVRLTYDIDPHWQLQGKMTNLFNKQYQTVNGFNTLDRNVFVGFRYQ